MKIKIPKCGRFSEFFAKVSTVRTVKIRQKKGQNRAAEWPLSVQGNGFAEFFIT